MMWETTCCIVVVALSSIVAAKRGYLATAPNVLHTGTTERVCLTFFDLEDTDINVYVGLKSSNHLNFVEKNFSAGEGGCVGLKVFQTDAQKATLSVKGKASNGYEFEESTEVGLKTQGVLTFIQTDKPQYKPGQEIQFRVLSLDATLRPIPNAIHAIWLEDPRGLRMTQWLNVDTEKGLVSLNYQTSEEPVLGDWKINVQLDEDGKTETKTVLVDEYVLPKYEISIKPPAYIPITAQEYEGEVCAKYTYGRPVRGDLSLKLCITGTYRSWKRPCQENEAKIDGCYAFKGDASVFELQSTSHSIWGARLQIEASVTETATGVVLNKTDGSAKVERHLLKLLFTPYTPEYFKPGLPFHGKVVVQDPSGRPASGQTVELKVDNKVYTTAVSDARGEVPFTLPPMGEGKASVTLNAEATDYASRRYDADSYQPYAPRGYHRLKKWFSPSGSFLLVHPRYDTLACDQPADLSVSYTTPALANYTMHVQVMSRGNIVSTSRVVEEFDLHNQQTIDGGEEEVKVEAVNTRGRQSGARRRQIRDSEDPEDEPEVLPYMGTRTLSLDVDYAMSPLAHVLVYYTREDGEVVADSTEIKVQRCLQNQVSLSFRPREVYPGGSTDMLLSAAPESLCSVGVVDKSVHVLGGNNNLTPEKIFGILSGFDLKEGSGPYQRDEYCIEQMDRERSESQESRERRSSMPYWPGYAFSEYFDSIKAFQMQGLVTLTDLVLESRPCQEENYAYYDVAYEVDEMDMVFEDGMPGPGGAPAVERGPVMQEANVEEDAVEEETVDLRTYFPETWLWEMFEMGESRELVIPKEAPHTITDWVGSAFCTNQEQGFGVSEPTTLRAFQPFFLSFTLPYSIVRGEEVRVPITVFNYKQKCIVIRVTMETTEQLSVRRGSQELCVCGGEAGTAYFFVEALQLGQVNITVNAESVKNRDWMCENKLVESFEGVERDAATKQILVEPEGKEEEYTYSNFMCASRGNDSVVAHTELGLPMEGLVEGSARAFVNVIGDVMGPTLSNLDSLLRLPTGCGEQNMVKFAPNIFVMQYLQATNQVTDDIKTKALGFLKTGYQRELTYRHEDGSYSAFGKHDDAGSTWLTAFVVRSFAQAREFIFINDEDLEQSIAWFRRNQKENGCFMQVGRVLSKYMKGGLASSDSDAGLTAYVLIALLDAGVSQNDDLVDDAVFCLVRQDISDAYTTALTAYAFSLLDSSKAELKAQFMEKLNAMAITEDGQKHWGTPKDKTKEEEDTHWWWYRPKSADVEMSAYALMATLNDGHHGNMISSGLPIVQWLSSQRNAYGGFASTQDTVVGLQSLAEFAAMVYGPGANVEVTLRDNSGAEFQPFLVTEQTSLILHHQPISVPNSLTFETKGTGCALVQANVRYNVDPNAKDNSQPSFTLRVNTETVLNDFPVGHCDKRRLVICARYNSNEPSNMAVVAVKMQTGWIPHKMSLKEMHKNSNNGLKRYEVDRNMVQIYFDELASTYTCMKFLVTEEMRVTSPKDAFVQVYDYYDTELSMTTNYKIKRTCGTKEEMPAAGFGGVDGEIVQERLPNRLPVRPDGSLIEEEGEEEVETACPRCLAERPEDFATRVCAAKHVYKTVVKRGKVRVMADLRLRTKSTIEGVKYVRHRNLFAGENCQCATLTDEEGFNARRLVLTKTALRSERSGRRNVHYLPLGEGDIVVPLTAEKDLRRMVRGCQ